MLAMVLAWARVGLMDEYYSLLQPLSASGVVAFTQETDARGTRALKKGLNAIDERRLFGERFECDRILSMATASEVPTPDVNDYIRQRTRKTEGKSKKRKPPNRCQPLYISQRHRGSLLSRSFLQNDNTTNFANKCEINYLRKKIKR